MSELSMSPMEAIRDYYQKKLAKLLDGGKVQEMTEAQKRHAESSSILVGCVLQSMAQYEQEKNDRG